MFINTISESKYSTFKQCKLKYRYKYIDYLKEDEGLTTDPLHFGSYIHKILEEGVEATTYQELEDLAKEFKPNYKFNNTYTPKIDLCLKNFLRFNASLEETVATELVYKIDVRDDISLNGIIDRVIKGSDDGYLIIDYKTSKREKTKVELYQDTQMKGYCYAIHKLYNVPIDKIVIAHYYPITDNLVTCRYSTVQIHNYIKTIVDEVWRIRKLKKTDFCASENKFCNWCSYKQLCPIFNDPHTVNSRLDERAKKPKR